MSAPTKTSKTVSVERPTQFTLRSIKTKGLRQNTFNGKKTPGFQISIQVPDDRIKEIQEAWESCKPKNQTPFFGFNDRNNMLTIKTRRISDKMKKECLASKDNTESIFVDIRFEISDIYIDDSGDRFPQLKLSVLKKVGDDDIPVPADDF